MKVLIADDDLVSRNLLHGILLPYASCCLATNGEEAFAAFESAWKESVPYDLVCLDIEMPHMDGQETLRRIRDFETKMGLQEQKKAKVIMTTAASDLQNVSAARQSKCEAYLVKPIEKERLLYEVTKLCKS